MADAVERVGVVGLGTMGAGIAEVFARNGIDVVAVEVAAEPLERGRATLIASTDRALSRGRLDATERDALLGRVSFAVGLDALGDVDLVVEAVSERLELKRLIFAELDRVCRPEAILATNTSSLSVTEISVATSRPGRVIGMHFFNPAPVMKLVEVVRTVLTDDEVVAAVTALCARLGKVGVSIADRAGFIANALLFGYLNQAVAMFEARYVSREDLDTAMRLGCGLPMGPLALLDLIGLDVAQEILDTMYSNGGRDRRHAPVPLLRQLVTAGLLGRKSGRGFYTYQAPGSSVVVPDELTPAEPADAAQTPSPPAVVAVVGASPGAEPAGGLAAALAELFGQAGCPVTAVRPSELAGLAEADFVIEAGCDAAEPTRELLARLGEAARPGALLASTTTYLSVIDAAMATGRPADVVGLHFAAGVKPGSLVEVATTVRTSPTAGQRVRAACTGAGLHPVVCADRAGLVVDALLYPYLNDAVKMLEASYSTVEDIDHAMTLGCGYPSGPFAVLDAVGLDVALERQRRLFAEFAEPGLAPAPLLQHLVTAGRLGRSTGHGFREQHGRDR
jgi:3-hydroxybutyryl-CoA dehydrogenase